MTKSLSTSALNNNRRDMLLLVVGCLLFGLGSVIVVHVDIGSYAIAFWRLLVAGVIFFAWGRLLNQPLLSPFATNVSAKRLARNKKVWQFGVLSGVFLGLDLALWHESIHAVGPGISTLLNSLQIFFLAGISYILFGEKQSKRQLASLFIAIIGVAMIASPEFAHNLNAGWGFVAGILSGAFLASSMTFIRLSSDAIQTPLSGASNSVVDANNVSNSNHSTVGHEVANSDNVASLESALDTMPTSTLMLMVSIGGCVAMLPLMLWLDWGNNFPTTWTDFGWILVYGAVMQCLAWGMIAYAIPRLSLAITGLLLLSEPVLALLIDALWLAKPITMMQWLGAGLTMFAIYMGSVSGKP